MTALATLTENLLFQLDNILNVDEIQGGCKWSMMSMCCSRKIKHINNLITLLVCSRRTKAGKYHNPCSSKTNTRGFSTGEPWEETLAGEREQVQTDKISFKGITGTVWCVQDPIFCWFSFYRAWPGVSYFGITDGPTVEEQKRETATITTAKTTMAQLKVMEVRNALHQVNGKYWICRIQNTTFRTVISFEYETIMSVVLSACICLTLDLWAKDHGGVWKCGEIQEKTGVRVVPLARVLEKPNKDTLYTQCRMTVRD